MVGMRSTSPLAFAALLAIALGAGRAAAAEQNGAPPPFAPLAPTESSWRVTGMAVFAPLNASGSVTDGHSLGRASTGAGLRADARYRVLSWLDLIAGADYYQPLESDAARHLALPLRVSFVPVHTSHVEIGIGPGFAPTFSWYGPKTGSDGGTLRAHGEMLELRLEAALAVSEPVSLLLSSGARIYAENFSNARPGSYEADGWESPPAAIDFGVGLLWRL
jgi:hypothetical protein